MNITANSTNSTALNATVNVISNITSNITMNVTTSGAPQISYGIQGPYTNAVYGLSD